MKCLPFLPWCSSQIHFIGSICRPDILLWNAVERDCMWPILFILPALTSFIIWLCNPCHYTDVVSACLWLWLRHVTCFGHWKVRSHGLHFPALPPSSLLALKFCEFLKEHHLLFFILNITSSMTALSCTSCFVFQLFSFSLPIYATLSGCEFL